MIGRYQTPRDFRAALEERLKQTARTKRLDLMRLRRQVVAERHLARLFAESEPDPLWRLQGDYALTSRRRLSGSPDKTSSVSPASRRPIRDALA